MNRQGWPGHLRRQAERDEAVGGLYIALAQHPLLSRIGWLRRDFERRATYAFGRMAQAELDAIALITAQPRRRAAR